MEPTGKPRRTSQLRLHHRITTVLYAVGKGMTAYINTPWGVGQLLVGVFFPALMAVVSETLPVAIGAGLGTFVG